MGLRLRLRRRRKPEPEWNQRVVVVLRRQGETALRIDLPMTIEEDDDGTYPTVHFHRRELEGEIKIDEIEVSPRFGTVQKPTGLFSDA
jgi:hypothetical protein